MVSFAETSRTNNIITKLYFPLVSRMQCLLHIYKILYVISIVLSLVSSGLKPSYLPFLKGQPFNISRGGGKSKKNKIKTHPTWKEEKMIFLFYRHKQKFCLIYAAAVTDVVTMWMSLKLMETSKPELKMQRLP